MKNITPFLWFDNQAEEAAQFYTSIFPDSKIKSISRYPEGAPRPKGMVMTVDFTLKGEPFVALNGGPEFKFTEAISFVVNCSDQEEIDTYWSQLSAGGQTLQCGWLKDKYGLAWQIVPTIMGELMTDKDPEKSKRVMQAMMKMVKLDIDTLQRAYDGK
jgi:predicted 3-demethylubiquinone-9 3-methyltransferase (glyoxalase superfamily)